VRGGRLAKLPECPDRVYELMKQCWKQEPAERPSFGDILEVLEGFQSELQGELRPELHDSQLHFGYKLTSDYNDTKTMYKADYAGYELNKM
jgi:hypothetical protein